ncbi:MAG TPA: hypothetical protein VK001_06270 [Geminicoccaceae bacterium]|nr:hypothetical protein [Geminicoccaceae bacterium]
MRGLIGIAVMIVGMTVALVGPAAACRVGGDQIIFDEAPEPELSGATVIHVRFLNSGSSFERWEELMPYNEIGTLVGVARVTRSTAGAPDGWFPVYARVTSCTHGFFGRPRRPRDQDAFLVGRFVRDEAGRTLFEAAGNWNGRWHF